MSNIILPDVAYTPRRNKEYKEWKSTLIPLSRDEFLTLVEILIPAKKGIPQDPYAPSISVYCQFPTLIFIPRGKSDCYYYDQECKAFNPADVSYCCYPILAQYTYIDRWWRGRIRIFEEGSPDAHKAKRCGRSSFPLDRTSIYPLPNK